MKDTNWRILIDYKVADYPNFEPDEELNEILKGSDGGSGTGFGYRDIDATFDTEEQATKVFEKLLDLQNLRYEHIEIRWFEAFACCHNPTDHYCICSEIY